ncbi:MAG: PAAR domain-containing protein [Bryobacteraceae bacterium]
MPKAARVADNHVCPASTGPVPHGGGPIMPPCSLNVRTNNLPQARGTDKAMCVGPPDFIVTGSGSVRVNSLPAARMSDKCMHGGSIAAGSLNVNIGGPTVGVTLGNPAAATAACNGLAGGRTSGSVGQSYNNCGVESSRLIINQTGGGRSEDGLLDESIREGDAGSDKGARRGWGGTSPGDREDILERNGVPTTNRDASLANIQQAVAERRGVITSHEVAWLWANGQSGGHAINVIGVQYDQFGNAVNYITADTGLGNCNRSVPAWQFGLSLRPGRDMNVTDSPIW